MRHVTLHGYRAAVYATILILTCMSVCLAAEPVSSAGQWVSISDAVLQQLADDGIETDWPGATAGIVVDPSNGDVYMIVAGQGVWKSVDQGASFARCDAGHIGGRCESAYSLNFDPSGRRLACFMLDGKCAWTSDSGTNWHSFTDVGRNWDYAAVDWSTPIVRNIVAGLHESGGQVMSSNDGGLTWTKLFEDPEFDKSGGLGIFNAATLVYSQKGKGIQRSVDGGRSWTQVSEQVPIGRVVRIVKGTAYWLGTDGLLVSTDQGASWRVQGQPVEDASIGPWIDPKNPKRMVVAGKQGIFQTDDAGQSWTLVATLPPGADIPKPGWYSNVAWDPVNDTFYVSKMGKPAYRWVRAPNSR